MTGESSSHKLYQRSAIAGRQIICVSFPGQDLNVSTPSPRGSLPVIEGYVPSIGGDVTDDEFYLIDN
jgi:hypothetical protein